MPLELVAPPDEGNASTLLQAFDLGAKLGLDPFMYPALSLQRLLGLFGTLDRVVEKLAGAGDALPRVKAVELAVFDAQLDAKRA